jgi:non-lysosomal glucosylceramidase
MLVCHSRAQRRTWVPTSMSRELTDIMNPSERNWPRRDFLKFSAAATLGLVFARLPVMAGPFTRADFEQLVPADKKLSPDWVQSLFARGERQVFRGDELKMIGMPVGGIGAGQLYLGGDGRLWHWDIFNLPPARPKPDDKHYRSPLMPSSPLEQGFAVRIKAGDQVQVRKLQRGEWREISFRGEYPVGRVEYADPGLPVRVVLEAFSPFIPLNTDDSSLPATILEFSLTNTGSQIVAVELCGWLENAIGLRSAKNYTGERSNQIMRASQTLRLDCAAHESAPGEKPFSHEADFGTMTLALLDAVASDTGDATAQLGTIFPGASAQPAGSVPLGEKLIGALARATRLNPGASAKVTFVLAWHFPNLSLSKLGPVGRHYATRFESAHAVAGYVARHYARLATETRLWRHTWYDSTLPFWFLDRTLLNASTLATSTCYRFANGRFYGWEGVGCCEGTCGHVYHYAHAIARLFPDLERVTREKVDFGLAQRADGSIRFRGELNKVPAIDAQAGTVLRALREHQMCTDSEFLQRNWPGIKRATEWLMEQDINGDGIIEGAQHNTLDTDWFGPVAWLSGLYLAALAGAARMADEVGDDAFAKKCRAILATGQANVVRQLFDGEYFINKVDPTRLAAINSGTGCEIDQVFGQGWAFHVGLPRILPKEETVSALKALWRYNFSPDVGPYRAANKPGRWYAVAGEAGLLMCTFPRSDWSFADARGQGRPDWAAGYFNECMNGFEYQVAGHMIWEGLVMEGLAVTRAVHDRYHASRRNPWNEIECGDHYARSMASYGVYLAAGGFEYDGPKQHIGFAPKLTPENFKSAFTSAEGWGSYSQKVEGGKLKAEISVRWGRLKLRTIAMEVEKAASAKVSFSGQSVWTDLERAGKKLLLTLKKPVEISAGETLGLELA